MKTEYKILWIDDRITSIRGDKTIISNFLADHGIDSIYKDINVIAGSCPTKDPNFNSALADIDLDIIFIDFNMPDENGLVIIEHIRKVEHHYHIPILFYTGDDLEDNDTLQDKINNLNKSVHDFRNIVDGIYFCHRDDISEKAQLILTSLLKKENKLQNGRGLLMDKVSEIDAKILASLKVYWPSISNDKSKSSILKYITKKLKSRATASEGFFISLNEQSYEFVFNTLLDDGNIRKTDTLFRAELLRTILSETQDMKDNGDVLSEFYNSSQVVGSHKCMVDLRNEYAHQTTEQIKAQHTDDKCKYIRTESKRHIKNIKLILKE